MSKVNVMQYKRFSIVVTVENPIQKAIQENWGVFVEKPTNGMKPCWVFSSKRKPAIESLAKQVKGTVSDFNAGKSIALQASIDHVDKIIGLGGHYQTNLTDANGNRFAGYILAANKQDQVIELAKTL